jgi:hypothetical protein
MRPLIRRTATAATATALLLGGVAAVAAPASAVGSSACTRNDANHSVWGPNLEWPTIRSGPGSSYSKKGYLDSAGEFYITCSAKSKAGNRWYYGEVLSGSTSGMKGWIWSGNF